MSLREGIEILLNGVNKFSKESELKREEATKFSEGTKTASNAGTRRINHESTCSSEKEGAELERRNK